jgi:hypothetical protein
MSQPTNTELPWYKSEAWLAVELAAFVPIALAFLIPPESRMPLYGVGALLALVGLGMLILRKPTPSREFADVKDLPQAE